MKDLILFTLTILVLSSCSSMSSNSSNNDLISSEIVNENIAEKNFEIVVNRALPLRGRNINLSTSSYSVKIKGDTVYSYLPYYGRAYSVPYGGGENLTFDGNIMNYKVTTGKRNVRNITFNVRTQEDIYAFDIEVWPNGNSNINVKPGNKEAINFLGTMKK